MELMAMAKIKTGQVFFRDEEGKLFFGVSYVENGESKGVHKEVPEDYTEEDLKFDGISFDDPESLVSVNVLPE